MADSELVEINLDRPFTTNGKTVGWETTTENGKPVTRFTGKAKVTRAEAEDLERRQYEYREYEASLHRDKGRQNQVFI